MSHDRTERKGSQVVHVRDGSDQAFDDLFKVVIDPPQESANKPFRMRNLPASFFQPPDPQKVVGEGECAGYTSPSNSGLIAHSRAHSSPASLQQTLSAAPPLPPQHLRQHSYDLVTEDQPLPPGWDIAKTTHGQSHLSQTTTWQDPRKSVSTNNLTKQQQSGQPSPDCPTQSQQAIDSTPLPPGWERAYTAEGEVYYINHMSRTTSWFHPQIPAQLQRPGMRLQQQQQQQQQQMAAGQVQPVRQPGPPPMGQRPMTPEEQQRQLKLQHLQREKERLKRRQEEIAAQQEAIMRNLGGPDAQHQQAAPSPSQTQMIHAKEMTSDPFLGHTGSTDLHSRQESGDSGLGGMGTSYSLPRTPEDFLMEDMDTQDGAGHKLPGGGEFGSMDITPLGSGDGGDTSNMDSSDDLVASLQEDISNELLKDVETVLSTNKDISLTWL